MTKTESPSVECDVLPRLQEARRLLLSRLDPATYRVVIAPDLPHRATLTVATWHAPALLRLTFTPTAWPKGLDCHATAAQIADYLQAAAENSLAQLRG